MYKKGDNVMFWRRSLETQKIVVGNGIVDRISDIFIDIFIYNVKWTHAKPENVFLFDKIKYEKMILNAKYLNDIKEAEQREVKRLQEICGE